jgi:hypothetical protein
VYCTYTNPAPVLYISVLGFSSRYRHAFSVHNRELKHLMLLIQCCLLKISLFSSFDELHTCDMVITEPNQLHLADSGKTDVPYFRALLQVETARLTGLCTTWRHTLDAHGELSEEGEINTYFF